MDHTVAKIQFLLSRLAACCREGIPAEGAAEEYLDAAQASPSPAVRAFAYHSLGVVRYESGRLVEALDAAEAGLRLAPRDHRIQAMCIGLIRCVHGKAESLGQRDPGAPEFGRSYERLLALGCVSLTIHLSAIHHYRLAGNREKAVDLLRKMQRAAPNFPGLRAAEALLTVQAAAAVASIGADNAPMTAGGAVGLQRSLSWISAAQEHLARRTHEDGIAMLEGLLSGEPMQDEVRADLLLAKALLLEDSGDPVEGLVILSGIRDAHPLLISYQQSLEECCELVARKASEVMDRDPASPALARFHALLEGTHYSPWWLRLAVTRQEARSGNAKEAMEKMEAVLALSPRDADYLAGACEVAGLLSDGGRRLGGLRQHIRDLISERPFRHELFALAYSEAERNAA